MRMTDQLACDYAQLLHKNLIKLGYMARCEGKYITCRLTNYKLLEIGVQIEDCTPRGPGIFYGIGPDTYCINLAEPNPEVILNDYVKKVCC